VTPVHGFFDELRDLAQQPGGQQALTSLTAAGAVLVSLITAVLAPIVAIFVARRQIRATVVSVNRQKWIESLRDALAELIAVNFVVAHSVEKQRDADISIQVFQLQNKILLLTDPEDENHVRINAAIQEIIDLPAGRYDDALEKRLVAAAHSAVKAEWERVRRGD
jgi:hypothetical protein